MKTKFISILMIFLLSLNPLLVSSTNISFDDLDDTTLIYLEDSEPTDTNLSEDNILETSSSDATETENINTIFPIENSLNTNVILEQAVSTMSLNVPTVTNYMIFSKTNTTFIDVTDLATGDVVSHDCTNYLGTNFDETNHWSECTICGKQFDVTLHTYTSYWSMGNSCSPYNVLHHICACGYYYDTPNTRSHSTSIPYCNIGTCNLACSVCRYLTKSFGNAHYNSSGQKLGCTTGRSGTCKNCGVYWDTEHSGDCSYNTSENEYRLIRHCFGCNKTTINPELSSETFTRNGNNFSFSAKVYFNGTVLSVNQPTFQYSNKGVITNYSVSKNGHYANINFSGYIYDNLGDYEINIYTGISYSGGRFSYYVNIRTDDESPVITGIQEKDINSKDDWITAKELTIQGTENYSRSVKLSMTDEEGNIYLNEVAVNVNNNQWSYTFTPNIESNSQGKKFIITVKDDFNNTTTKDDFILYKVDKKPPTVTTTEKATSTEWSKTKNYTVSCTDLGIGDVNIAFNDLNEKIPSDYENNYFYKNFIFTGDVYGKTTGAVYYVDGLGNTNTSFVDIYNLDNTFPTIEKVVLDKTLHSTNVTIQANDFNTKLNAEGSGITGYAITTNNIEPTDYQESNNFTVTKPKTYYLWVKDLVGNVTSKEMEIPIQYKVTINPDGGTWKGSTKPQEVIISSNEKYDFDRNSSHLSPIPEKEGYTFTGWKVTGEGYITDDGELIVTGSDVEVIPIWETNQYSVTYIDYDLTNNQNLNQITKQVNFNTVIRGFDLGNSISDNAYYNQYRLVSDTESKVSTSNNIVYRYFEFCYTEKSTHLDFNDNDNIDNLRPETYILQLQLEDGTLIDEVTLSSDVTDYTFEKLPKYDENGAEYKYLIIPIISDRYKVTPNPENGEPEVDYSNPEYSILIPKLTTLDGKTGDLNYTLKVNSTLFYDDKIIITPDDDFLLTDGISTLTANVLQNQTTFTKEDILNNQLTVNGDIQVNKQHFAGTWTGVFNFNIKYETRN